jgi:hypothetical protein
MKILLLLLISTLSYGQRVPTNCDNLPDLRGKVVVNNSFVTVPLHDSYIIGSPTIYLDVDGELVNNGNWQTVPFQCEPANLNESQITEVWERTAQDYRPFNINVTTNLASYLAAPINKRIRVIITPTSGWKPGVGGIAWTGSFIWGDNTPVFVFSDRMGNNPRWISECSSHEAGHSLGLNHQVHWSDTCTLISAYYAGQGSNGFGWAPIMGNSYFQVQTLFSNGQGYTCPSTSDELAVITRIENGVTYRERTGGQNINLSSGITNLTLIIHPYRTDSIRLHVNSATLLKITATSGGNVDTKTRINGVSDNPLNGLNSYVQTTVQNGNHWLEVFGVDNQWSPDYGNTGEVKVQIEAIPLSTTPVYVPTQTNPNRDPFFRYDSENIYIRASRYAEWALLNSIGQVIKKGTYKPGSNVIPLPHSKGLYILKTEFSNHKIIK